MSIDTRTKMRSFVPFGDPWQMPISVPYSFLVRDKDLAWTCGQVPIDRNSNVLAPDDLTGQTNIVCDYIEDIFKRGGLEKDALAKLVLYYVKRERGDAEKMMACCRAHFGNRPVLVPIAVPYFYFEGLLLEVDAFAGAPNAQSFERSAGSARVAICDSGELVWAALTVAPNQLSQGKILLQAALSDAGLSENHRLCEHWITPPACDGNSSLSDIAGALGQLDLISDQGTLVEGTDPDAQLIGEITYVKRSSEQIVGKSYEIDGVKLVARRSGRFTWYSARSINDSLTLVAQTSKIMNTLADALHAEGWNFRDIVKSTSHYVGGSSQEELLDNMQIRNWYYDKPGPASTGLPVSRFADDRSRICVDVLAVRDLPNPEPTNKNMG